MCSRHVSVSCISWPGRMVGQTRKAKLPSLYLLTIASRSTVTDRNNGIPRAVVATDGAHAVMPREKSQEGLLVLLASPDMLS